MKKITRRFLFWLIVYLTATSILAAVPQVLASTQTYDKKVQQKVEKNDALDMWINDLARYECEGCGPHYRRIDNNGEYSYSCLQFQENTFREAVRIFDPKLPESEIGDLIYDCAYQKELARAMLEAWGSKAARHWATSVKRGLGMPPTK